MKKYIISIVLFIIFVVNIDAQSKFSISGNIYYANHLVDNINSFGLGTSFNYQFHPKWDINVSFSSIFGESRGIVPRKNAIKLTVKEYETLMESNFFDHYLKHFSTTFNKYYTFISDFSLLRKRKISKFGYLYYGGGMSLVYFDLENIDYVYDAKFYKFGGSREESYTLIIPRYDRFYDIGIILTGGYELVFKEYMTFKISPSINYYFKSGKLIFKNSIGIGFYF